MEKIFKCLVLAVSFMILMSTGMVWAEDALPELSEEAGLADELATLTEPQIPGKLESTGTYFEIKDSEYLNITLKSSEQIKLTMESVPEMITMHVESAAGARSTQVTISGLAPDTTYHKYEDNYHNHEAFTTDDNGSYTYAQDLSAPHLIFIQPRSSTKFIRDDATGGDCYSIGIWDSLTKICTLTMDVYETIQIDSDGITFDGNGHTLTGNNTGNGIFLSGRSGVTIKNFHVNDFTDGIYILQSKNISLLNNNTESNNESGIRLNFANNNTLTSNKTSNNSYGIYLTASSENVLTDNNVSDNNYGILLSPAGNYFNPNYNYMYCLYSSPSDSGWVLCHSYHNNLRGNTMTGNKYNFNLGIYWDQADFEQDIDTSNLVNNKPVYFIKNSSNQIYDASTNAGVFYCINCNNVTIEGLILTNNYNGLFLYNTHNSTIRNITTQNNYYGIYLSSSTNNSLAGNNASNNSYGIYLSSSGNTLDRNTISNNYYQGINVSGNGNIIMSNTIESNTYNGISLYGSNNIISSNTVSSNRTGLYITGWAFENIILDNNISNNSQDGILVLYTTGQVVENNICNYNGRYGIAIALYGSSRTITLSGNKMSGNLYNLFIPPRANYLLNYDIDITNLVEGKPVYYIKNASNQTFDATTNAGTFYCINCDNVIIEGLTLTNTGYGLLLYNTQNSIVRNNTFANNYVGMQISSSSNNIIYNNNFINNSSYYNYNTYSWVWRHISGGSGNIFNLPAPIGGNFWSNWTTPDNNGDGFVDNPYVFSGGQDNLPWTTQDGWKPTNIDNTDPTTIISLSGTSGNNGWYLSNVQVTLTATDNGGSGVAKTEFSFNGTNWYTYTSPFTVSAEGENTIYYRSTDNAGNTETAGAQTVKIRPRLPLLPHCPAPLGTTDGISRTWR